MTKNEIIAELISKLTEQRESLNNRICQLDFNGLNETLKQSSLSAEIMNIDSQISMHLVNVHE